MEEFRMKSKSLIATIVILILASALIGWRDLQEETEPKIIIEPIAQVTEKIQDEFNKRMKLYDQKIRYWKPQRFHPM